MSDVDEVELEPGETLEAKISSRCAVLQRPKLTNHDRGVLQRMLTAAQDCKQKKQGRAMSSLLTKYGVAPPSDVIEVDESLAKQETKATRKSRHHSGQRPRTSCTEESEGPPDQEEGPRRLQAPW